MWEFLKSLPVEASFSLLLITIIAFVVVALRGHIRAILGDKNIEIGRQNKKCNKTESIITNIPRRSCGDCVLLIIGEREKFEVQINKETNKILKSQMIFTEQKLIEIQNIFMGSISDAIHNYSIKNSGIAIDESVQYKLVYGLFRDSLWNLKDELRRSFKDNGFYDMNQSDFLNYIKDRISVVYSMIDQYIRNIFPDHEGVIGPMDIIGIFEKEKDVLSSIFTEIYVNAKNIRSEAYNAISMVKTDFKKFIDNIINPEKP